MKVNKVYSEQNCYIYNPLQDKRKWSEIKEVKKMKKRIDYRKLPYLDCKVVKVKKGKGKLECKRDCSWWNICEVIKCPKRTFKKDNHKPPKGDWVNGENLDKIKFPCLCKYKYFGKTRYAILSKGAEFDHTPTKYPYSLIVTSNQEQKGNRISESFEEYDLREMILKHNVHILKAKIIIYEEEE